jgi:hypothetical protein
VAGVVLHTDQGSEYTAGAFRAARVRLGIRLSMGRPGSALDNAAIEAWHSTLEFELRSREHFATKAAGRAQVAAWIDEYNRNRRHSALGMVSPIDDDSGHPPDLETRRHDHNRARWLRRHGLAWARAARGYGADPSGLKGR